MSNNEKLRSETNQTEMEWNAENEIQLFYAMRGHKPIGVSKNFHMIAILDAFVNSTAKDISSKPIWEHLAVLYDMETLHENEEIEFPNIETEFTIEGIPEFDQLIANKTTNESIKTEKDNEMKEQSEPMITSVAKSGTKLNAHSKGHESNKTNTKAKVSENEKNVKSERKEETVKHEKSDETEDKSNRSKKLQSKAANETRSAAHNTPSSAKKRKN